MKTVRLNRSIKYVLLSQGIYTLINWIDFFTLLIQLNFSLKEDFTMTIVLVLTWVSPMIFFAPSISRLIQKYSAIKIMKISLLCCALISIFIGTTTELWMIFLLVFIRSSFFATLLPTEQVLINILTPNEHVVSVCSYKSTISQSCKIIAPVIAAGYLELFPEIKVFYCSFIVFLLAYMLTALVRSPQQAFSSSSKSSFKLKELITSKRLLYSNIYLAIFLLFFFVIEPQFPKLFISLSYSAEQFSFAMSAVGVGGIVASIIVPRIMKTEILSVFQTTAIVMHGVVILLFILINSTNLSFAYPLSLILFFISGAAVSVIFITCNVIVQLDSSQKVLGSIFAFQQLIINCMILLGPILGMIFYYTFGLEITVTFSGFVILILGIVAFLYNKKGA